MPIHANMYMHDLDRNTLQTLKAIPGFTPLLKAYMKISAEQQYYIQNMSCNLRLGEKQLPKYYNMLHPICAKLGIPVPELYVTLEGTPNAYTYGDTNPFIVVTTGLLETMPDHAVAAVLAHECGHIACRHTLYHSLGRLILNGGSSLLGLTDLVTAPLQAGFFYWMRCSEYSADRAAAICCGSADPVVEMCMRFAGFGKRSMEQANMEAFLEQARQYHQLMKESTWSKTLEVFMYSQATHPLTAVRAYESNEWQKTDAFRQIVQYLQEDDRRFLPMPDSSRQYIGRQIGDVHPTMVGLGYENVRLNRLTSADPLTRMGQVTGISVAGQAQFSGCSWYPRDAEIVISYYQPLSQAEIQALHPGEIQIQTASRSLTGKPVQNVMQELTRAGFRNIRAEAFPGYSSSWSAKPGTVAQVLVDGLPGFEKGSWIPADAQIQVQFYGYSNTLPPTTP